MRNLSANGAFEDTSASTRGPIGCSSSMQAGLEKLRIDKGEPRRIHADRTVTAYITRGRGARWSTTCY